MTAVSSRSWTILWTTFTGGWLRFWRKATLVRSANILTPCRLATTSKVPNHSDKLLRFSARHSGRRFLAFVVAALLPIVLVTGLAAQTKKKKSTKPKPTPCRAGCKPDTTSPDVATATPEDAATHKELSELARNLHNAAPGAYEKLSAFSTKHSGDIWGARAALALGYDDYQKNKAPQALAWFTKAKADTLLREYALFWTAQTKRVLKRNPEALADLNTIQREYPNTAIKE